MNEPGLSWESLISEANELCSSAARASAAGQSLRVHLYLDRAAAILERRRASQLVPHPSAPPPPSPALPRRAGPRSTRSSSAGDSD